MIENKQDLLMEHINEINMNIINEINKKMKERKSSWLKTEYTVNKIEGILVREVKEKPTDITERYCGTNFNN